MLTPIRYNTLGQIRQISGSVSGLLRNSGFESRMTFGWNFGVNGGLRSLSDLVIIIIIIYLFIIIIIIIIINSGKRQLLHFFSVHQNIVVYNSPCYLRTVSHAKRFAIAWDCERLHTSPTLQDSRPHFNGLFQKLVTGVRIFKIFRPQSSRNSVSRCTSAILHTV